MNLAKKYKTNFLPIEISPLNVLLILILLIAAILRLIKLQTLPLGIYLDESSVGLNAYSIIHTGRDQYGEFLPIYFKCFGDYRSPVIIYFCALFTKLFGPSVFSLRLASALAGIITVFYTYKLTKLYFNESVSLLASFLLAVSSWHINFSRIALDKIFMPTFLIIWFYYFYSGLKYKSKSIIYSAIPLALCFYSYTGSKAFVPLLLVCFAFSNLRLIFSNKKNIMLFIALLLTLLIPFFRLLVVKPEIHQRIDFVSITYPPVREMYNKKLKNRYGNHFFFDSDFFLSSYMVCENYFKHFTLNFLLINGDSNLRHNSSPRGQIPLFLFMSFLVGAFYLIYLILIQKKMEYLIFILWVLISPLPSALTWKDLPHSGRMIGILPVLQIISSVGLIFLINSGKRFFTDKKPPLFTKAINLLILTFSILIINLGIYETSQYFKYYFGDRYTKKAIEYFNYSEYLLMRKLKEFNNYNYFLVPQELETMLLEYLLKIKSKNDKNVSFNPAIIKSDGIGITNGMILRVSYPAEIAYGQPLSTVKNEITGKEIYYIRDISPKLSENRVSEDKLVNGLTLKCFIGVGFEELTSQQIDKEVFSKIDNFTTEICPELINNPFSLKWQGFIKVEEEGWYDFFLKTTGSPRLQIGKDLIVDDWNYNKEKTNQGKSYLNKGFNKIEIDYFNFGSRKDISLKWKKPNGVIEEIPSSIIYTNEL